MLEHSDIIYLEISVDSKLNSASSCHVMQYSGLALVSVLGLSLGCPVCMDPGSATYAFAQPRTLICQSHPESALILPFTLLCLPYLKPYYSVILVETNPG